MSPASGGRGVGRLRAALAENASLRLELETLRAERNWLEAEVRRAASGSDGLLSGTLHDFKNLLTVISGHTELMQKRLGPGDPLWRNAEAVRKATEAGNALTQQLLETTRRVDVPDQDLDMKELVGSVLGMLEGTIPVSVDVDTRPGACVGAVRANRQHLEQVLVNLVVNALDAMPDGGHLTIETCEVDLGPGQVRRFSDPRPGRYVMVTVRDTGHGMDAWVQARVFQPYFTTKEGKGNGLGLATAQLIVTRLGGAITVTSAPGHGSSFQVYLPRASAPSEGDPEPHGSCGTVATVLVVEDEREIRELCREILELHGHPVFEAEDTETALALAARHGGPIDLVITEVVVPGLDTTEFRAALRRLRPDARLLYVSGHSDDEIARCAAAPSVPVLKKPFAVGALAQQVREILETR